MTVNNRFRASHSVVKLKKIFLLSPALSAFGLSKSADVTPVRNAVPAAKRIYRNDGVPVQLGLTENAGQTGQ